MQHNDPDVGRSSKTNKNIINIQININIDNSYIHINYFDFIFFLLVDELLRLVAGYQYAAVHGEVCPSNWKPGGQTIKPTPQDR
jgi:alkyl hydroperoxide reductase subunit AhpC